MLPRQSLALEDRDRFNNILVEMMHLVYRGPRFLPDRSGNVLFPFAETMFATYLVWHDKYVEENGLESPSRSPSSSRLF